MTTRDENAARGQTEAARELTYQRQAEFTPDAGTRQQIPHKWKRVLAALLAGCTFNRFEAERPESEGGLSDHCLHSTISTIQSKGVRISRKFETVPGYQGIKIECCRYWLNLEDLGSVAKARDLLSNEARRIERRSAITEERWAKAIEQERRARAARGQA